MSENDSSSEVADALRTAFAELLQCDPIEVDLGTHIMELPGMDSMKLVKAVVACEKRWQIALDEDELFEVRTGEDLCFLIEATISGE
ncbi:acyl carrier protein [Jatrophihabitans sp. GAS493]|uniref:acyl carrier protein n=1 Tax=Jatrophihabitans sp. GAS493 TaxID=1907575 RepID=UPI000BB847C8|nr:acyl carrier protein [Jatrophihabitans sp. GAS493]SOD75010.1 acyl carrier protein [Jatrophihabitans sp. GAS493]